RESLASSNLAVSYNGKSFDLPLLQSRMVMNRIQGLDIEQLDLLHVARRFWRDSLESCRLGTIEREVLGIFRVYDMPSAEIPWWYQHYLRTGSGSPARIEELSRVAAHHAMDHLSMALLLQRIGAELLDLGQDEPGR